MSAMAYLEWFFWLSILGVAYAYIGYPIALLVWARLRPVGLQATVPVPDEISIVLPVHNEIGNIRARLDNLLSIDVPEGGAEIIVVSDNSTDGTTEVAREYALRHEAIHVLELPSRGGKAGALNAGASLAKGPIVIFTDASITLEQGSLLQLLQPFSDPKVGCVSGEDFVRGGGGESTYSRYEFFLRRAESAVGSIVGASGSFYGQRRDLVPHFVPDIAPDLLSVLHTVERGYRAISEPGAVGYLGAVPSRGDEFQRKVRTVIRGMAGVFRYKALLNPFRSGRFAWILGSHKIIRWLVPVFLATALATSAVLSSQSAYAYFFTIQLVGYAFGGVGLVSPVRLVPGRLGKLASFFLLSNAAIAFAWLRFAAGHRISVWSPSRR